MEEELQHRKIRSNGIWMHIAEQGKGPLVLLLHGFPELWFSWRHQITHLAKAGYHVVAPDLRGYGDTDSPPDPYSYTLLHLVGDIVGLLDDLGQENAAFVVGHDWGATVAWHLALFRPDRIKGLVALGVPYFPRSPSKPPVEFFTQAFGEGFYISQFQEPGRAEKSFARHDTLTVMKKFLLHDKDDLLIAPTNTEIIDFFQAPSLLPPWISDEELQYFAHKFQQSGFTGALNYYRAMDMNWELTAPWQDLKIMVPSKLIIGSKDIGFESYGTKSYVGGEVFRSLVPNVQVVVILEGHHYIQQERAQEVTDEILSFFGNFSK